MCHTWLNGSDLEKWVALGKMEQDLLNMSHLEKWVTFIIKGSYELVVDTLQFNEF